MKVGILTFPNSTSYGATLQMYALYHTVKKLGHDVEVINYFNTYMKAEKHYGNKSGKLDLRRRLRRFAGKLLHRRLEKGFRHFEKKNMALYPHKPVLDKSLLPETGKRYGAVICGSDQVWNPNITDSDLSYFLDFCTNSTRRIAYAPSFGIDTFSKEFSDLIRKDMEKFDSLSVREKVGCDYVASEFDREAELVCDPTLLLTAEEWARLEEPYPAEKNGYILYYTVLSSKTLFDFARKLSKKTGLKLIFVGGNFLRAMKNKDGNFEYAVDISPSEWLWLVHNARYVVTNSFHGAAFSAIFRKSFYLECPLHARSRIDQMIDMLVGADPVIKKGECEPRDLNYSGAEEGLRTLREQSVDYLKKALGD